MGDTFDISPVEPGLVSSIKSTGFPPVGSSLLTKGAFCKKSGLRSAQNRLRIDLAAGDTTVGSRPRTAKHCARLRGATTLARRRLGGCRRDSGAGYAARFPPENQRLFTNQANQSKICVYATRCAAPIRSTERRSEALETQNPPQRAGSVSRQAGRKSVSEQPRYSPKI